MKLFQERELDKAYEYAGRGGQALHVFGGAGLCPDAPKCFKKAKDAGHLLDSDIHRLTQTARRLGVRKIKIGRLGKRGQHVDLCGKPLERAKGLCNE